MLFIAPKEEMYTQLNITKVYTNISYTITFHTFYGTYGRNVFPNYTEAIKKTFHAFHSTYGRNVFPNYTQGIQYIF